MIGTTFNGYTINRFIGRGAFGEVYEATQLSDMASVAIKFIKTDFIYPEERERLNREVDALKKVVSPFTIRYISDGDYIENNTTYKYVVMEYIEGQTLQNYLSNLTKPLTEEEAITILVEILTGLGHIHDQNIIHRDLKPANIMMCKDGIKILDYGLSKLIDYSSITKTGAVIGTYYYMSPEQVQGKKPITIASDFYSIGVILLEALTKQILFYPSTEAEIVYKTVYVKPPIPSSLNPSITNRVENIILKLIEKDSFKRYLTAKEIIDALNAKNQDKLIDVENEISFYPRLIQSDTAIIKDFISNGEINGADFPINLHAQYNSITNILKSNNSKLKFFADPSTNRMVYTSFRKTQGLVKLPYAPTGYDPYETENFSDISTIKDFVKSVLDLQIANGCSVLTAPFFYFNSIHDEWYQINLKMLRESIDYIRASYPQYKISGAVCTSAEVLSRKSEREKIIESYGYCRTDYLQFYIDKIDETTVDAQIFNFILTATSIKAFNKTKIIACRVPSIALGLLTIGFDAITSGLGVLDTFDKGVITKEEDMVQMPTKFYFSDLLMSSTLSAKSRLYQDILAQENSIKAKYPDLNFSFKCNCSGCDHQILSKNFQAPRLHFLYSREKEIHTLRAIEQSQRRKYFIERIDKAYLLQTELGKLGVKLKNSPAYLNTWKEIIKKF